MILLIRFFRKVKKSTLTYLKKLVLFFYRFDHKESILIFSDPRGGSTWLMEMLENIPNTAIIWEPLHIKDGVMNQKNGWGWRQYIPAEENWIEVKKELEKVLSGKKTNSWVLSRTPLKDVINSNRLIVKFVRANSSLQWIAKNFDFNYKPIYLLRHPCAVAASSIKAFEKFGIDSFKVPNQRFNAYFQQHENYLSSLSSTNERLIAYWCLHNMENLKVTSDKYITIFYEDLLQFPEKNMKHIFKVWQQEIPDKLLQSVIKPSGTSIDLHISKEQQLRKWISYFNDQEIEAMQNVLDYFQITIYSTKTPYPIRYDQESFS